MKHIKLLLTLCLFLYCSCGLFATFVANSTQTINNSKHITSHKGKRILIYKPEQFGAKTGKNVALSFKKMIDKIHKDTTPTDSIVIQLQPKQYIFSVNGCFEKTCFISNHDQDNPKNIGVYLENLHNVCIDGNGADLLFTSRMIPIFISNCSNINIQNINIDYTNPQIGQAKIVSTDNGITVELAKEINKRIDNNGRLEFFGDNWSVVPIAGIAFEEDSHHIVYNTSDVVVNPNGAKILDNSCVYLPQWKHPLLKKGMIIALRGYERPCPGIVLNNNINSKLTNINVRYAEGMGLLAQMCENINLDGFNVQPTNRYFTTQADATHFSGCKGIIRSVGGYYEGMMDDAINVHGTYLKVVKLLNNKQFIGRYMHYQTYGIAWGQQGDTLQFIKTNTMDRVGGRAILQSIQPNDTLIGTKDFLITVKDSLPNFISGQTYGVENLTQTPSVYFANNIIKNNRARGALFSTPKPVIVENNIFDHTSGSAILLCGDCNGWYETGACCNVVIRKNSFINALTNMFQFTNAVISIYPEIPNLDAQTDYFHSGIIIEDNIFETFDAPIVYAKSVKDLKIINNTIKRNRDYKPFHWNKNKFLFEKCGKVYVD